MGGSPYTGALRRGPRGVLKRESPSAATLPGTSRPFGVKGKFQLGSAQYVTPPGGCWGYHGQGVIVKGSPYSWTQHWCLQGGVEEEEEVTSLKQLASKILRSTSRSGLWEILFLGKKFG